MEGCLKMMNDRYLATLAFDTFCETTGDDILDWDDLTPDERAAWKAVVRALKDTILDDGAGDEDDEEPGSLFDDGDSDEENEDDEC